MKTKPRFRVIRCAGEVGVLDRKTQMVAPFGTLLGTFEVESATQDCNRGYKGYSWKKKSHWQVCARNEARKTVSPTVKITLDKTTEKK